MTVEEIIKASGGPNRITDESGGEVGRWAPYKWPKIGIPEQHWALIRSLSGVTVEQLHEANELARASKPNSAATEGKAA